MIEGDGYETVYASPPLVNVAGWMTRMRSFPEAELWPLELTDVKFRRVDPFRASFTPMEPGSYLVTLPDADPWPSRIPPFDCRRHTANDCPSDCDGRLR